MYSSIHEDGVDIQMLLLSRQKLNSVLLKAPESSIRFAKTWPKRIASWFVYKDRQPLQREALQSKLRPRAHTRESENKKCFLKSITYQINASRFFLMTVRDSVISYLSIESNRISLRWTQIFLDFFKDPLSCLARLPQNALPKAETIGSSAWNESLFELVRSRVKPFIRN